MNAIEVHGLHKAFRRLRGRTVAVENLDLEVASGGVFGFLGPNGSGKTTTIRCLLGLVRPDRGTCRILGADATHDLRSVAGRIGSIVETPTFFPGFSGYRNLELLAIAGGAGTNQIPAVLERVGLGSRGDDRFKTYSLGMKQRLGLAGVLLKDPELLILDEPANGLDPAGIKEIRDLLRSLADEGRTVFVSSHQLAEVQMICDSVAILSRGRSITQGSVEQVLSGGRMSAYVVRVRNVRRARAVLRKAGFDSASGPDGAVLVEAGPKDAATITRTLADAGLYLSELRPQTVSLESVFLELTEQR